MFEESCKLEEIILYEAAKEFIEFAGVTGAEKHAEYILRIARAFIDVNNPQKARKILIELEYDALLIGTLENIIREYFGLKTSVASFKIFWKSLASLLVRLQLEDNLSFQKIIKGIIERKIEMEREWIQRHNLFQQIKEGLGVDGEAVDTFLQNVYDLNIQVGNLPSGKGEHIFLIFFKDSKRGSDIIIRDIEYEIKTSSSRVGGSVGSTEEYRQKLTAIFASTGEKMDFNKLSFGKLAFENKWAPIFLNFANTYPSAAVEFFAFQYDFYLRRPQSYEYIIAVNTFLLSPNIIKLANIYDVICVEYVKKSLNSKDMMVFDSKSTGSYWSFSSKIAEGAVSFVASKRDTPLKITLPKSSASMLPEIVKITHKK